MFKVVLKNTNFSVDLLSRSIEKAGKRPDDFLKNYGIIFESQIFEEASSFSAGIFRDFKIETFVTDLYWPICKQPVEPDLFNFNMCKISKSGKDFSISSLKAAVLASCKTFEIDLSPFRLKDSLEKTILQNELSLFVLLDFIDEIFLIKPENLDYSRIFDKPDFSSTDNFHRLLSNLYSINPFIWNKTADLFVAHKDIKYFTYTDEHYALKELSWLRFVKSIEVRI